MPSETALHTALFERLLVGVILALAFVGTFFVGFATTYVLAGLALVAIGYLLARRGDVRWRLDPMARIFLAAFVLLAVLFALTATTPRDVELTFNFTAFLIYAPLAILLSRHPRSANALTIASLALAGVGLATAICVVQVFVLNEGRAAGFNSDTIRFADTAVIFGFLSVMGWREVSGVRRWLFLLGPVLALGVVVLTGARIDMIAYPAVAVVTLFLMVPRRWVVPLAIALVAVLVAAGLLIAFSGNARFDSLLTTIGQIASGQTVSDESVHIRLELYRAGWQAFLQSPLIGHGWAHMMSSAGQFLPADEQWYTTGLPHLHNELLNFAVFGGLVGVALYVVLLVSPVWLAVRSPLDAQHRQRVFGTVIVSTAYVMMGLTDTMVSFELHTAFYVVLTATILTLGTAPAKQP